MSFQFFILVVHRTEEEAPLCQDVTIFAKSCKRTHTKTLTSYKVVSLWLTFRQLEITDTFHCVQFLGKNCVPNHKAVIVSMKTLSLSLSVSLGSALCRRRRLSEKHSTQCLSIETERGGQRGIRGPCWLSPLSRLNLQTQSRSHDSPN